MKNKTLTVSECFYSIQGEGQTMGHPAIFLRLAGCNLLCKSKEWICDSIEVWQKGTKTSFTDVLSNDYIKRLKEGAHLIITGGEPLLWQKKIVEYLSWFHGAFDFLPIIEIETNGTIIPSKDIQGYIDYWNCSPKLQNSGESAKKRINMIAIQEINKNTNSIFKFVISKEEDFLEMLVDYEGIDMRKVWLMPAGDSQELLSKTRKTVAELCIKVGVRYTERLHVNIWNQATGV